MIQVTKTDVLWNYLATFLKIGSFLVILPIILKIMPEEKVGVYFIFISIASIASILDFGFGPTLSRNVTYIYSGAKELKATGYETIEPSSSSIDYSLLGELIQVMKLFYKKIAALFLIIVTLLGLIYIKFVLSFNYTGDMLEIYIAWIILCLATSYNLLTLYYDSLLMGAGLIKESKKIIVLGNLTFILLATFLLYLNFGLPSLFLSQFISFFVIRVLARRKFFDKEITEKLKMHLKLKSYKDTMNIIKPNALKTGLTSFGSFLVYRSTVIIGSIFIELDQIASFGLTQQIIKIIITMGGIYLVTIQPQIIMFRIQENKKAMKRLYLTGKKYLILITISLGILLISFGDLILIEIGSQTSLIMSAALLTMLIFSILEANQAASGSLLLTENKVPFFKASLLAGTTSIIMLVIMLSYLNLGIWALVLAPGLAQIYNNFKWPYEARKLLNS